MRSNSEGGEELPEEAGALFRHFFDAGAGLDRDEPKPSENLRRARRLAHWTDLAFAEVVKTCCGRMPDKDTMDGWKTGAHAPRAPYRDAVLATFFPPPRNPEAVRGYSALRAAWDRKAATAGRAKSDSDEQDRAVTWQLGEADSLEPRFVQVVLEQPEPANRGGFRIRATVAISDPFRRDMEGDVVLQVSLKEPVLQLHGPGYPPRQETKLGAKNQPHPFLRSIPNAWIVDGTERSKGQDLTEGEALVEISGDGSGQGEVSLTLKGTRDSLDIRRIKGGRRVTAVPSKEKLAVLHTLFGARLGLDPEDNTVILARHAMRRKTDT